MLPWGADTAAASALVEELNEKIEQYFSQCDLRGSSPTPAPGCKPVRRRLAGLDITSTELLRKWIANAPLAPPREDGVLDLAAGSIQTTKPSFTRWRRRCCRALNLADSSGCGSYCRLAEGAGAAGSVPRLGRRQPAPALGLSSGAAGRSA